MQSKGTLPIPKGWSYDNWMAENVSAPKPLGPFSNKDVRFWLRGSVNDFEVGFDVDGKMNWVDYDDLTEIKDKNIKVILATAEEYLDG